MQADDGVLRVLFGKTRQPAMAALSNWIESTFAQFSLSQDCKTQHEILKRWWKDLEVILQRANRVEAELKSRAIMLRLVDIVQGSLLMTDALSDKDEIAIITMQSWFEDKEEDASLKQVRWEEQSLKDLNIVFGKVPKISRSKL